MNKSKEALDEFWLWLLECLGGAAVFLLIALPYAIAAFAMQWANDNYGIGAMAMVMFVCIGVLSGGDWHFCWEIKVNKKGSSRCFVW